MRREAVLGVRLQGLSLQWSLQCGGYDLNPIRFLLLQHKEIRICIHTGSQLLFHMIRLFIFYILPKVNRMQFVCLFGISKLSFKISFGKKHPPNC